jgi:uncharacterized coiled-coil protein SlyX
MTEDDNKLLDGIKNMSAMLTEKDVVIQQLSETVDKLTERLTELEGCRVRPTGEPGMGVV